MSSGITSSATASRAFAANFAKVLDLDIAGGMTVTIIALAFMVMVAAVNFRGVGESVKLNVVLTCVELSGLLIVIMVGMLAIGAGKGDVSRAFDFSTVAGTSFFWP